MSSSKVEDAKVENYNHDKLGFEFVMFILFKWIKKIREHNIKKQQTIFKTIEIVESSTKLHMEVTWCLRACCK